MGFYNTIADFREYYYLLDIDENDPPQECLFNLTTLAELMEIGDGMVNVIRKPEETVIDVSPYEELASRLNFDVETGAKQRQVPRKQQVTVTQSG